MVNNFKSSNNIDSLNDRQLQLIEASIKLIGDMGIQGLTIKNLAKEIGFAESAVYRHFESKTKLLLAVMNYLRNNIVKYYSDVLNEDLQPADKLKKLMLQHMKFFNSNPPLTVVLFSDGMYRNEPELTETILSIMQFVKNSFMLVIDDGIKHHKFRKDIGREYLAFIIMGSIRLTINQWSLSGYKYKLTSKFDELSAVILKIVAVQA